jgi:hypothetical protein
VNSSPPLTPTVSRPAGWLHPLPWALIAASILTLAAFGNVLWRDHQFAFRDAAHFYYPLYQTVEREWAAGRVPLWSPEENAGMPLLGNPTAAVLYPLKLIYTVYRNAYAWGARAYIIAHVLLALAGMIGLMHAWGASPVARWIAGLTYAFGAPVLFQNCNVVFLVGAAWIPCGLWAADAWLRRNKITAIAALALILALQTLGGDPQAAYILGLCAMAYAAGLARWAPLVNSNNVQPPSHPVSTSPQPLRTLRHNLLLMLAVLLWCLLTLVAAALFPLLRPPGKPRPVLPWAPLLGPAAVAFWTLVFLAVALAAFRSQRARRFLRLAAGLGLAALLAGAITAAQLLPVLEFTGMTVRASVDGPHEIFPFSTEPYRLAELFWPQVFGSQHGLHHNWLNLLPPLHAARVWIPSLYVGGLAILLALATLGFRNRSAPTVWLSGIALLSLLAAIGEFGSPLWLARNCIDHQGTFTYAERTQQEKENRITSGPLLLRLLGPHDAPDDAAVRQDGYLHDGDGSLYGLLTLVLPGFKQFRYPSKLLVFSAVAIAGLAGFGWDRLADPKARKRTSALALSLCLVSALVLLAIFLNGSRIQAIWKSAAVQFAVASTGPFDPPGAYRELLEAGLQGTILPLLVLILCILAPRRPRIAGALALLVVALDLGHAIQHDGIVLTVPQALLEQPIESLKHIQEAEARDPAPGPFRIHRLPYWTPALWSIEGSPLRYRQYVEWERRTMQPKYLLPDGGFYTLTEGTAELYDYRFFFSPFIGIHGPDVSKALGLAPEERVIYHPRRGFDLWNTRYFVLPYIPRNHERRSTYSFLPRTTQIWPQLGDPADPAAAERIQQWGVEQDWMVLKNREAFPRAWIVHSALFREPVRGMRRLERVDLMTDLLFQGDELWQDPRRTPLDLRATAILEIPAEDRAALAAQLAQGRADPADTVAITRYEPQRVELQASLASPGLVILADTFYPGWQLALDGQPVPILRANRLMRAALVPAGSHTLVYSFHSPSFETGLLISAAGLAAWAPLMLLGLFLDRRQTPESLAPHPDPSAPSSESPS